MLDRKELKSRCITVEDGLPVDVDYVSWEDVEEYINDAERELNYLKLIVDKLAEILY